MCIRDRDSSSNFLVNSLSIVKLGGPKTKTLSTIPNPNAICAIPVSYTHLDVYKRQVVIQLVVYLIRFYIFRLKVFRHANM